MTSEDPEPTPSASASPQQEDSGPSADSQATPTTEAQAPASATASEDALTVARRFLEDDTVHGATREKKTEFLKAKGVEAQDIERLLDEAQPSDAASTSTSPSEPANTTRDVPASQFTPSNDRPPIITYPEFLVQTSSSQPKSALVTTPALLTTASALAGFATLVHGTSRYLLQPMLESLTASRIELHDTTSTHLDALVTQLEKTVSTIPPVTAGQKQKAKGDGEDDLSDVDDPSEMFHRDVGTQTEYPLQVTSTTSPQQSSAVQQFTRLTSLTKSLNDINSDLRSQSTDLDDIKTLIDVFQDDLDALVYGEGGKYDFSSNNYGYGGVMKKNEPDDEIKKVKDGIRRIKGALLSTRSFPSSTA